MYKITLLLVISLIFACKQKAVEVQDVYAAAPMMCAPQLSDADWYKQDTPAPLFEGMDILLSGHTA